MVIKTNRCSYAAILLIVACASVQASGLLSCLKSSKTSHPFDDANSLLAKRVESDDLATNTEAARKLVNDAVVGDCKVKEILETFSNLRSSYKDSCTKDDIDKVHAVAELMVSGSANNPYELPQNRRRMNKLVIDATSRLITDCSEKFLIDFGELSDRRSIMAKMLLAPKNHFIKLISDIGPSSSRISNPPLVIQHLKELEKTNFDKLRNLATSSARDRWVNFSRFVSDKNGIEIFSIAPETGKYVVSKEQVRGLYKIHIQQRCEKILDEDETQKMEALGALIKYFKEESVHRLCSRYYLGTELVYALINYEICKELRVMNGENFVDLIKMELEKKISRDGKTFKW